MINVGECSLWTKCLAGDMESFKNLYLLYHPRLMTYGRHIVNDSAFIEDCIQDLFIKMIQNRTSLSPTQCVSAYILKAFRNKIFDTLKSRRPIIEIDSTAFTAELRSIEAINDENLHKNKKIELIMSHISLLSPNQQEAIYLYYIKGLKHEEIATVMGINYQSSKNLLNRAIIRLRQLFADSYEP